jgi:hypothetical protein
MSLDSAKSFMDALEVDLELRDSLDDVRGPAELLGRLVRLGADRGFAFTADEVASTLGMKKRKATAPLCV